MPGDMGATSFENVPRLPLPLSLICTHTLMQDAVLDFVPIPEEQTEMDEIPSLEGEGCLREGSSFSLFQVWG